MHTRRKPTYRELDRKLLAALAAFDAGRYAPVDSELGRHAVPDMEQLRITELPEYWDLVYECILLAREDPVASFRPPNPPKSTKHKSISDLPLWAFSIYHEEREKELYFKFCLREHKDGTHYVHIDCHESQPK